MEQVRSVATAAFDLGALEPIPTQERIVERFLVRQLIREDRKEKARKERPAGWNPFLPYEEALFVEHTSPTHVCLLNKFNVVADHLLLVTNTFQPQDGILNAHDFHATWTVFSKMQPQKGLMFYNSSPIAGASQRHKHLQIVPVPLIPHSEDEAGTSATPFEPEIHQACANSSGRFCTAPELPFLHLIKSVSPPEADQEVELASQTCASDYVEMLSFLLNQASYLDLDGHVVSTQWNPAVNDKAAAACPLALNFLMTSQWMMMIPRRHESFCEIPVNALGFAGTLMVRTDEQMEILRKASPWELLRHTGFPSPRERSIPSKNN